MLKEVAAPLSLFLFAGCLVAQDGFVGVYVTTQGTTMVDDEVVGFAPQSELRFDIAVVNEEGGEELFADGGIVEVLAIELVREGESFESKAVSRSWNEKDERYAFFGGLPPEPSQAGIIEPGVGLRRQLVIRRHGAAAFGAGRYELNLRLVPGALLRADGSPWSGRGGRAGVHFELRDASTSDELQLKFKLLGHEALMARDYAQAEHYFRQMVELDSTNTDGWSGLGIGYYASGEYEKAVECLERVMPIVEELQLDSSLPILLAESHLRLGNASRALEALRIVVAESQLAEVLAQVKRRAEGRVPDQP